MKKRKYLVPLFVIGCLLGDSCKKYLDVNAPITNPDAQEIYSTPATATAAVTGIYTKMAGTFSGFYGPGGLSLIGGLSADELQCYASVAQTIQIQAYTNSLSAENAPFWSQYYNFIYATNAIITGLSSSSLQPAVKSELTGEAEFLRAYFYFYLVNLYGPVPLFTTTNYTVTSVAGRAPVSQVYQQIIADLKAAQQALPKDYVGITQQSTTERTRPNYWAATALLARAYLYSGDWTNAEIQSGNIINNKGTYSLDALNNVFLANRSEAIWQLQPVDIGYNSADGFAFVLTAGVTSNNPVSLSTQLMNAFEPGDMRQTDWVGVDTSGGTTYYFPYKYKIGPYNASQPVTEYQMVLRLGEQYLIRAEAAANGGNGKSTSDAITDLNMIRTRAGLPAYSGATDKNSVLTAILHERQVELFTESAQRWLDLKRTGAVNTVMSIVTPQKGGTWSPDWQWYPIVRTDIALDKNLAQNAGY